MSEMKIKFSKYDELLPLAEMMPSPYQRNKHPQEQIERLALIMREHGVRHPISISKRTNTIAFGHGRREAALLNGWDTYPVIYQDFDSESEEYAVVQSDNAIATWAELDQVRIQEDMSNFPDLDMSLLGLKEISFEKIPEEPENTNAELDIDSFDNFEHTCPKCNFGWNDV